MIRPLGSALAVVAAALTACATPAPQPSPPNPTDTPASVTPEAAAPEAADTPAEADPIDPDAEAIDDPGTHAESGPDTHDAGATGAPPVLSEDAATYQDFDLAGCPFLSIERQAVACWKSELDMGFGFVALQIFDLGSDEPSEDFALFARLENDEADFTMRPDAIAEARAALADGGFVQIPTTPVEDPALVTVKMTPGTGATAQIKTPFQTSTIELHALTDESGFPGVSIAQAQRCCKWSWTAEAYQNTAAALITFHGSCDFIYEEGNPCHTEDINGETTPQGHAQMLVRLR